jgi:hypothetical protein
MANKKVDDSIYQLKIKQGLNLLQAGVFTVELAATMELPYDEIMKIHSESQADLTVSPEPKDDGQHKNKENTIESEVVPPHLMCNMNQTSISIPGEDDPCQQALPASDHSDDALMSDGDDSVATQVRGSPNKQTAAGSHNAGAPK